MLRIGFFRHTRYPSPSPSSSISPPPEPPASTRAMRRGSLVVAARLLAHCRSRNGGIGYTAPTAYRLPPPPPPSSPSSSSSKRSSFYFATVRRNAARRTRVQRACVDSDALRTRRDATRRDARHLPCRARYRSRGIFPAGENASRWELTSQLNVAFISASVASIARGTGARAAIVDFQAAPLPARVAPIARRISSGKVKQRSLSLSAIGKSVRNRPSSFAAPSSSLSIVAFAESSRQEEREKPSLPPRAPPRPFSNNISRDVTV